ncbi:hypothetical protein Dxin01_01600 [Deinococcus xinjiangensis]|uniref:Uncharacterized protein n=1 Tax=Deinococcus xinjiangensis TaxID=457454 RepID=A0ABP9VB63_9DEIO
MTVAEILIDDEGRLQADAALLSELKGQRFTVEREGGAVILKMRPRRLSEIEDMEERMAAYQAFKKRIMRPGGQQLPSDWETIRDSIYD